MGQSPHHLPQSPQGCPHSYPCPPPALFTHSTAAARTTSLLKSKPDPFSVLLKTLQWPPLHQGQSKSLAHSPQGCTCAAPTLVTSPCTTFPSTALLQPHHLLAVPRTNLTCSYPRTFAPAIPFGWNVLLPGTCMAEFLTSYSSHVNNYLK